MKSATKTKIILADDHEIFLEGMIRAFEHHPNYQIIATCKNGDQLLRGVVTHKPEIVLTDINMPVMSGIEAIQQIRSSHPSLICIVLTNYDTDHLIMSALEAGAFSYVNKAMQKSTIFEAIESSINEIPYYCKSTSQRVLRMIANSRFGTGYKKLELFNEMEKQVIALFCQGLTVKEIAGRLYITERTIERYKLKIMDKMEVKTAHGIVVYAVKNRLVNLDDGFL